MELGARNLAEVIGSWSECQLPAPVFERNSCWALRTGHPHLVVAGDDTDAIRQLQDPDEENLDAQSIFLLSVAYAEMGQEGPAAHSKEQLNLKFPESVFAKVLNQAGAARPGARTNNPQKP